MAISVSQIDEWRSLPSETEQIEFKEARAQIDMRDLYKYCVSIGNERGGHLILGVKNEVPHMIVSTTAIDNPVGMAEKIYDKLGFRVDIDVVDHPEGRVVVITIPSRPRGGAFNLEGAFLMRCGQKVLPMSEDRLRRIFREGDPDWLEEPCAEHLGPAQIIDLLDTSSYFRLLNLPYPSNFAGVMDRLVADGLIKEEGGNAFFIRRIGALLLAKRLSLFPDIKRKAPRVIVYGGTSKTDDTSIDEVGEHGYAVGFEKLVRFVTQHLPKNEVIQDALRREFRLIPEVAVRELVANALIHQDFTIGGSSVMIEIYTNRLEVSNPGESIVPMERLIDGYRSRNERLADLMRRMGICEERGRGIDEVVKTAEMFQLPAPGFYQPDRRTLVAIHGHKNFDEMDREERIRACYQHCALRFVMSERMTNQTLRERFRLPETHSAAVTQVIVSTQESGMIKADESSNQSRKYAKYVPFWA